MRSLFERIDAQSGKAAMRALHPLVCFATSREQANAILFLASSESSFATGHTVVVDGGYSAR